MVHDVKISGKEYPIAFTTTALTKFSDSEGIPFMKMDAELADWESWTLQRLFNFIFHGLKEGARKSKEKFSLTLEDFMDLIEEAGELESLVTQVVHVYGESIPKDDGADDAPKKKGKKKK